MLIFKMAAVTKAGLYQNAQSASYLLLTLVNLKFSIFELLTRFFYVLRSIFSEIVWSEAP